MTTPRAVIENWVQQPVSNFMGLLLSREQCVSLLADLERYEKALEPEEIEEFIQSLRWSPQASDHEKSLVAGNIRNFVAHLRRAAEDGES